MFDIAWSELLLIAVLALIFIGPKELPYVLNNLGRMTAKLRRSADEFRRHFEDSMREAGYEDLHKNFQDFRSLNPANQLKETIDRAITQDHTPSPAFPAEASPESSIHNSAPEQTVPQAIDPTPDAGANAPETVIGNGTHNEVSALDQLASDHPPSAVNGVAVPQAVQVPVDEPIKDRAAPVA
jgi:sec-independent protein translocase protein TatB